jgi:hypothetical protein
MAGTVPAVGTSPFSHLARAVGGQATSDDNEPKKPVAAAAAEDDKDEDKDKEKDKAKKAKAEDSEDDAEGDDKDKEKDSKKSKKSKAADDEDGDDDTDREDDDKPEARAARARERGRIQAIVLSDAGKANPVAAMQLACGTSMSRKQAINMLAAFGPAAVSAPRDGLRDRMALVPQPAVGAGGEQPAANLAQQIILAGAKARGESA